MKLVAMIMAFNELTTGHLPRCLNSIVRYCDNVVFYDDGSTDGTPDYAETFFKQSIGKTRLSDYVMIRSTKNDFEDELAHKQEQLEMCKTVGADWIIRLDVDEILAENGVLCLRDWLEVTNILKPSVPGVAFHTINLWRNPNYYRLDNGYNSVVFNRLWRVTPDLHFDIKRGLHLTNYPVGVTNGEAFAPYEIIHWGFASDKDIIDKYSMYRAHSQTGWALNRLVDESTLELARPKLGWFADPLAPADFNEVFASPIADKV